jgi:demethylmenaquinone methyltransferase/2-methoxy-6-polyprenyl-1,4-benzoquinol methylase
MSDEPYRSYIVRSFDRWARFYDPFASLFRVGPLRKRAVEMSGVGWGDRVLDVCTGTGAQALEFAKRCEDVTAVDLSAGMLAVARKKDKDNRVRFLRMDATAMGFVNKEFDVSCISFGLHDMPREVREEVLREMARVTTGRIVIVDYKPPRSRLLRALYVALISLYESKYFSDFMRSDFGGLLARCGLREERESAAWLGFLRICVCGSGGT